MYTESVRWVHPIWHKTPEMVVIEGNEINYCCGLFVPRKGIWQTALGAFEVTHVTKCIVLETELPFWWVIHRQLQIKVHKTRRYKKGFNVFQRSYLKIVADNFFSHALLLLVGNYTIISSNYILLLTCFFVFFGTNFAIDFKLTSRWARELKF